MAQRRNVFTRIGRPPMPKVKVGKTALGEPQGLSPMSNFDSAIPASAFRTGGSVKTMPKHHPDPGFCGGGPARRR